ncbi:hypothetical protein Tco_0747012 [Tanacetum coccineum]
MIYDIPQKHSTVIRFCLPERRSARLIPPAPVPNVDKADELILQDTLQVGLAEHKSREEQEAREKVELVNEHLSIEIEKMVEGSENVIDDSSTLRNDETNIFSTRLEPMSDKDSPKVEINNDKEVENNNDNEVEITHDEEVEITNVVIPMNVNGEEEEITDEVYELKQKEKGKVELTVNDNQTTPSSSSPSTKLSKTNRLLSLFKAKPAHFKRYKSFFQELQECYGYLFGHPKARFLSRKSFDTLVGHLQDVMVESLPTMVDKHVKEQVKKQVPKQVRDQVPVYVAEGLILERQKTKDEIERMIAKAILQERGNIQAEIFSQIQQAIDNHIPSQVDASVRSYMSGHILHVHPNQSQTTSVPEQQYQLTSAVRPRDQDNPHDDAHPKGENSAKQQKTFEYEAYVFGESSSRQVNEEKRDDDEIPTKQVSQDIMEEVSLTIDEAKLKKMADEMLRQRCTSGDEHQYHIDQMKNFLKSDIKGNSGLEKIVLSLHKFPSIIFNDDDMEEQTSRWVNKCVKKFNPYARYGVEHWKNPHAKIFYIRKQKEPGKPKEVIYSNSKIVQVIKTYWELGHEHKFITKIVARRANDCIMSITEPDYKNLNKNDIEDIYLLITNGKVNLTAPTISFPGVERHKIELMNDEVKYLKLFEEEIEVRLKYRNQMRRWEMYVNGRPLGP